jgi:hypothetical protein
VNWLLASALLRSSGRLSLRKNCLICSDGNARLRGVALSHNAHVDCVIPQYRLPAGCASLASITASWEEAV